MKTGAKNFLFAMAARAIKEIWYYEATSSLMRYYIPLQADAQEHTE